MVKINDSAYFTAMWSFYVNKDFNNIKNNVACTAQLKGWNIKGDQTKHIFT